MRNLGYIHVGTAVIIGSEGSLLDARNKWELFLDRVKGRYADVEKEPSSTPTIDAYLSHLIIASHIGLDLAAETVGSEE